jgi:hypothetical protein
VVTGAIVARAIVAPGAAAVLPPGPLRPCVVWSPAALIGTPRPARPVTTLPATATSLRARPARPVTTLPATAIATALRARPARPVTTLPATAIATALRARPPRPVTLHAGPRVAPIIGLRSPAAAAAPWRAPVGVATAASVRIPRTVLGAAAAEPSGATGPGRAGAPITHSIGAIARPADAIVTTRCAII